MTADRLDRLGDDLSRSLPPSEGTRYDYDVDDLDRDGTAARLVRLVGRDKRVLDVGCAAGSLDRVLTRRGCTVVGIEVDAEAAGLAVAVCERVVVGDLERMDLKAALGDDRFDVILAGDVIEHLRDPADVLTALRDFLRPGGYLVLSVPNLAHGSVRLALLRGDLPRSPTGLLDGTHVQFMTRQALLDLLERSGWTTVHLDAVLLGIVHSEVPFPDDPLTVRVLQELREDPEALAYQYVAVAFPQPPDELDALPLLLRQLSQGAWLRDGGLPRSRSPMAEADLAEELYVTRLAAADAAWRFPREVVRLQQRVWALESALARQVRALRRLKRKAKRRRTEAAQEVRVLRAELEAAQAQLATVGVAPVRSARGLAVTALATLRRWRRAQGAGSPR